MRVALLAFLIIFCASGQTLVNGRVVDDNGTAVESVRVEFRAADVPPATAISDASGEFSVVLPKAGEYSVRAERLGYFVFTGSLSFAAGANTVTITINRLQEFAESIDVVYSPPAINPQEPADTKQLTNIEVIEAPYPSPHDLRNALPLFPGVVQDHSGRLHFNGGAEDQINLQLDGFNIADPATGQLETRVNIDSVQTLELESSRFSPEKGRGSAGSLNIRTRMGDDRWRFGGTNFFPGVSTTKGIYLNKWTPRVQVSGPVRRGRAWFHNGFDAFYDVDVLPDLPRGEDRARSLTLSNLNRFQVNLTPSNILTGSVLLNFTDSKHRGLSFLDPLETTLDMRQNVVMWTLKNQMYFRRGALVELGFADSRMMTRENPQGSATYQITPFGRRGNYFVDLARHSGRQQWVAKAFLAPREGAGSHQIRFGTDLQRSSFDQTVSRHPFEVLRADLSLARRVTFAGNTFRSKTNFETAVFAEDLWNPRDDLAIEYGLRGEWDQVVRDTLVSPRIAAAWAPGRLRDTKLAAGYGIFYDSLSLGRLTRHQDQVSLSTFYGPGGGIIRGPIQTSFVVDESSLRVPKYQTLSLSVERKLPFGAYGKAIYTRRSGRRGFTFSGEVPHEDAVYALRNWRNDRYDAFELTLRRTFAAQYEWFAGYTRSSARSDAVLDFSLENPTFAAQSRGPFPWDVPHRFLTWGWAPVPRNPWPGWLRRIIGETNLSYLVEYRTGFPFNVVTEEASLVGAPNAHRFPSNFNVNLHLERRFRLMHYIWAWRFGINNVTGSLNPNTVNNILGSPGFLTYGRGQPRAFSVRLRFLGRR